MSVREILEELASQATSEFKTYDEEDIKKALSAIHSELKGLVEDDKYIGKWKKSPYNREMTGFNKSNALWRTKLAEVLK